MTALFRTEVPVRRSPVPITHKSTIMSIGSCFAETMGTRLRRYRFKCTGNPTGILFNPASIAGLLDRLVRGEPFVKGDLFLHQGVWKSFSHHSCFSHTDPDSALRSMNDRFLKAVSAMKNIDVLLLTFGAAAVYYHKEREIAVANCHRLPGDVFERRLLSIDEIVTRYSGIFSALRDKNPALLIVPTVSPVRHLRDDPHENSVSKSRLIAAVYELEQRFPQNVHYFPAYEIMMDELRDYRFYEEDMAHPNGTATRFIWERFQEACLGERARTFIGEFEPILKSREHRIKREGSAETEEFLKGMKMKIEELGKRYPEIDLGEDNEL